MVTVITWIHILILVLYTIEMLLKLAAWKKYYFRKWWNILDFLVVVLSLMGKLFLIQNVVHIKIGLLLKLKRN